MNELNVIALAREAGLCFPDCHFLDADPYENILIDLQMINNEEEREAYMELVKQEDARRRAKLRQLEKFAGLIIDAARQQLQSETEDWHEKFCQEVWTGVQKSCNKLQWMALDCGVYSASVP